MIFPALLLTMDKYSSWRVGGGWCTNDSLSSLDYPPLSSEVRFELNQTVIDVQRTDSMMAEQNCFSSSCGRLNSLSWRRKFNLCWAFFTMESM